MVLMVYEKLVRPMEFEIIFCKIYSNFSGLSFYSEKFRGRGGFFKNIMFKCPKSLPSRQPTDVPT